jgi:hypothetical protein
LVTWPLAPKLMLIVLAGARLPLPETVDWTTPLVTVTVRSDALLVVVGFPTRTMATTTPAMASRPRARLSGVR